MTVDPKPKKATNRLQPFGNDHEPEESIVYQTEQYRAGGISHCADCGEKFRTGMYGEAICAIDKVDCTGITHHA